MRRKVSYSLICLLLFPTLLWAGPFGDRIKRAFKQMEKKNYPKAAQLLTKELTKKPASAGAKYGFARYYFAAANPRRNVDTSYRYVLAALADYGKTPLNIRKRWQKIPVNDSLMQGLKLRIDSLGFAAALDSNRVEAYQLFLDKYPTAQQKAEAVRRRDELAFAEARRINTYESYKQFMERYPNAEQLGKATEIYDLRLFETQTQEGTVMSYARFAAEHPQSPYRKKADEMAFGLFTAPHLLQTYHAFVRQFPENTFVPEAWAWLLYLYGEEKKLETFQRDFPDYPDKPYLQKLLKAQSLAFFPVYEEDRYGFLDSDGQLQIPVQYDSTAGGYFCEGVKDDFILVYQNGKLGALDKTGKRIADFAYEAIDELEKPLLLVRGQGGKGVVHEGGFEILPPQFDTVEVLNDYFLKTVRQGKQGLSTMNGLTVYPPTFDEIRSLGTGFVSIRQNNRYALLTNEQLLPKNSHSLPVTLAFRYDKIEWIRTGYVKAIADSTETIIDQRLQPIVPPQRSPITALSNAWLVQDSTGYRLMALNGAPLLDSAGKQPVYQKVVANGDFFGVKYRDQWGILDSTGKVYVPCEYDSLGLIAKNIFLLNKKKSVFLHTANRKLIRLDEVHSGRLQPADPERQTSDRNTPDGNTNYRARAYLTLENKSGKQALYTTEGKQLLPFWYESIRVAGPNLFVVESNRKVALKDSLNKLLLPLAYDGLSPVRKGFVATLKGKKFGLVQLEKKLAIPPQYESLLQFYDADGLLFVARKSGKLGLIDRKNKEVAPFQFDDIRFWQNSVALVKESERWRLYDFVNHLYFLQPFDDITYIQSKEGEIVLKVYADKHYGILSSLRGPIIPAEYDDLGNAGDEKVPFYVAEKVVDAASVYLLFYFDQNGKLLRKQIFNEEVYEKIVCE